jgi:Lon protease-like protein
MGSMPEPLQLQSLPLFPLGTVLYPDSRLPLRIFEVRYLDMIGKCHKNGTPFGVVALTEGSEVRQLANRWCELLQLPLELKQRLMALENPLVRLELVRDILDKMGVAP